MSNYWYIWYEIYENDILTHRDKYRTGYKYKQNAQRRAKRMWSKDLYVPMTKSVIHRKWIVSQTCPWTD